MERIIRVPVNTFAMGVYMDVSVKVDEFINGGVKDGYYAHPKYNSNTIGFGTTEDEAIADMVKKLGCEEEK